MKTKVFIISGLMAFFSVCSVSAQSRPPQPKEQPRQVQPIPLPQNRPLPQKSSKFIKPMPPKPMVKKHRKPFMRKEIRTLPMPIENGFRININFR